MTKPEHTIPFNMAHARAGAPFCGTNGEAVRVIIWDRNHPTHPILAIEERGDQEAVAFSRDGHAIHGEPWLVDELVMTPLGMLDGNPVFAGDILEDDEQFGMGTFTVGPTMRQGHFNHCKWPEPEPAPAPAKVYPETRMFGLDLHYIYANNGGSAVAVANAALRHAVDSGQVMLPGGELDDDTIMNAFSNKGILPHGSSAARDRIIAAVKSLLVTEPEVENLKADLARSEKELCTAENALEDAGYRRNKDGGWEPPVGQLHKDSCFLGIVNVGHISGNKNVIDYVSNCISLLEASQKREVAIANTMREACCDILEQFNDRHACKRSDTIAACRLVINHLDVNAVLAGVDK